MGRCERRVQRAGSGSQRNAADHDDGDFLAGLRPILAEDAGPIRIVDVRPRTFRIALANLVGVPVGAGERVSHRRADRKPLLDADVQRIVFERPVTIARWTVVVDKDGKIASLRNIVDPVRRPDDDTLTSKASAELINPVMDG